MRYDKTVYFQTVTPGPYDDSTGDYGAPVIAEESRLASVVTTDEDTLKLIYGGVREDSLTIHLQNAYKKPFDRIRIGDRTYTVDRRKRLRTKQVFIVSQITGLGGGTT